MPSTFHSIIDMQFFLQFKKNEFSPWSEQVVVTAYESQRIEAFLYAKRINMRGFKALLIKAAGLSKIQQCP